MWLCDVFKIRELIVYRAKKKNKNKNKTKQNKTKKKEKKEHRKCMPVELKKKKKKKKKKELGLMGYSIWNPYTPYGRFWKSVSPRGCEFSNALDLLCDFYIRFITEE